jgi:hypothetical protein
MTLRSRRPFRRLVCLLLAFAAADFVSGPATAERSGVAADPRLRSASWTSCKVLASRRGQQSLQGLLARQWIVGYLSGVVDSAPETTASSFKGSEEIMDEVRRYCRAHPKDMAVDAAETLRPVALR